MCLLGPGHRGNGERPGEPMGPDEGSQVVGQAPVHPALPVRVGRCYPFANLRRMSARDKLDGKDLYPAFTEAQLCCQTINSLNLTIKRIVRSSNDRERTPMRAAVVTQPGGPEVLKVLDVEEPVPGPDDVLVEVRATALNRADLAQRQGQYPAPSGIRQDVPGLEMAGVALEVGERVTEIREGDRVFGLLGGGGYAERVVTSGRMLMPIPENLSFIEAASIPEVFFTAYDALFNQCVLKMGDTTLIHAVGSGVGTAAVQLAHHTGAFTLGTAGSPEKLQKAAPLGLDVGINYREEDFLTIIQKHTAGRGVDVLLDVVGAPYWERNLASLAVLGRMILVGAMGGDEVTASLRTLTSKRLRVFGTGLRVRHLEEKIALTQQVKKQVLPLLAGGQVQPVVDRVFPLEEASSAHAYMEANLNFGKIVLSLE